MPAAALPAIIGAVGAVGSSLIGSKNKGSASNQIQYNSGRSPQAQALEKQMYEYISKGMGQSRPYAQVNPMMNQGMNLLSQMFMGRAYTPPQYGMSAPGGGPQQSSMPPGYGQQPGPQPQGFPSPYRMSPEGDSGMPPRSGPMYPPSQFYGRR